MIDNYLVELKGVWKIYKVNSVEVIALQDMDLVVGEGEFTAIVGPSGSGKTTLLNLIGAIDVPTKGMIKVFNEEINKKSKKELALFRRKYISFIFQTYNLLPTLTVFENVELPLRLLNVNEKEIRKRVFDLLDRVGIKELYNRYPAELSGGQQQRVAIARALVKEPKLVLADEPTANLDSHTAEDIMKLMKKLNEELKVTFIFSTHDPLVMKYARRIVELRDGKIISDKRLEE